jgi:hypothetical protein
VHVNPAWSPDAGENASEGHSASVERNPVSSLVFEHFRFPAEEGEPAAALVALERDGWEHAGEPRLGMDLAGRRVVVYRMRRFPEAGAATHPATRKVA